MDMYLLGASSKRPQEPEPERNDPEPDGQSQQREFEPVRTERRRDKHECDERDDVRRTRSIRDGSPAFEKASPVIPCVHMNNQSAG